MKWYLLELVLLVGQLAPINGNTASLGPFYSLADCVDAITALSSTDAKEYIPAEVWNKFSIVGFTCVREDRLNRDMSIKSLK